MRDGVVRLWDANTGKQHSRWPDVHHGVMQVTLTPETTEGVYLKGQGVVFTLTLPPGLPRRQPPDLKLPPAKLLSDWERMCMQSRGEEPKKIPPVLPSRQPDLDEVLLKIMADNGRHFSQLGAKEKLTIAVTFRSGSNDAQVRHSAVATPKVWDISPSLGTPKSASYGSNTSKGIKPYFDADGNKIKDLELLADLQLKQFKVDEAIQGYLKAVALNPGRLHLSALYSKLARAYLIQEEQAKTTEQRNQAIEKGLLYLKRMQGPCVNRRGATANPTRTPPARAKAAPAPSPRPRANQTSSSVRASTSRTPTAS